MKTHSENMKHAIIQALRKHIALSTDALCEPVGLLMSLPELDRTSARFKTSVYRVARRMEPEYLASAKVWNGKTYERVWRRA